MRHLEFELSGIGGFWLPPLEFGRRADRLHGLDVERRVGRRRVGEDAFPDIVQFEEELDFLGAQDFVHDLHGGLAHGAEHRVGTPDAQDEVAPERVQFAVGVRLERLSRCCRVGFVFGMGALAGR